MVRDVRCDGLTGETRDKSRARGNGKDGWMDGMGVRLKKNAPGGARGMLS